MTILCQFREWDSSFFKFRIAQVTKSIINSDELDRINQWCSENTIDCVYFLADPNSYETTNLLESSDFHYVDMRLTLEYNTRYSVRIKRHKINTAIQIRQFVMEDLPYLKAIIVDNHYDSRFYRDPRFCADGYHRLYTYWIEKECREKETEVFVATYKNIVAGYITCKSHYGKEGQISLSGVSRTARNLGVGSMLIEKAMSYFSEENCIAVKVVTQGANIKAQRLYSSNGFYPLYMQLWYHKWFTNVK
jgi:dTDP-4-amino-4,6-dideoxy-D-galactose acyltransferase